MKEAQQFENCLSELLQRVLEQDLGWEVLKNRVQPAGPQQGKDIQLSWRTEGREYKWAIECKSHTTRPVSPGEVVPKLLDAWRSPHNIDVWCLALAHIEPGQAIDELLPDATKALSLPFGVTVLSPSENALPELFACYPDLYATVYSGKPTLRLSSETRARRIAAFRRYLLDTSMTAREPTDPAWALVTPDRPDRMQIPPDSPAAARAYLRGLASSGWDSVAYEWAVPRPAAVQPIEDAVQAAKPGINHLWLVGPAGEGKTTVGRLAAWSIAAGNPNTWVLWADGDLSPVKPPVQWLEALGAKTPVVMFVDGTNQLRGLRDLFRRARHFETTGRTLTCIFLDRGVVFSRSRARRELSRVRISFENRPMASLSNSELADLIGRLSSLQLLAAPSAEVAEKRLQEARDRAPGPNETSWLLPTLMELTDPENRGFEQILEDVIDQLSAGADAAGLKLLFAIAIAHSARIGLPRDVAVRLLAPHPGGYGQAADVLQSEIARQLGSESRALRDRPSSSDSESRVPRDRLFAYSGVVAEGFLRVVRKSHSHEEALIETCEALVGAADERGIGGHLRNRQFDFLHHVGSYLLNGLQAYDLSATWFDNWVRLDDPPTNFVALQRLGECMLTRLQAELATGTDSATIADLATRARAIYIEGIEMVQAVLADGVDRPVGFEKRSIEREECLFFNSWAVLEDVMGSHSEGAPAHLQAAFLSILSMPEGAGGIRGISTLGLNLIHLQRFEEAAVVTSALFELDGRSQAARAQSRTLSEAGYKVVPGGLARLGEMIAALSAGALLADLSDDRWPYSRDARIARLATALRSIEKMLPNGDPLQATANELQSLLPLGD